MLFLNRCRISTYKWDLEKWYQLTYQQGRNSDSDTDDECVAPEGEGEGGARGKEGPRGKERAGRVGR